MNAFDVVGVVIDTEVYCTCCADENEGDAIFAGAEFDYQPNCNECGEKIEVTVLEY